MDYVAPLIRNAGLLALGAVLGVAVLRRVRADPLAPAPGSGALIGLILGLLAAFVVLLPFGGPMARSS